jgi:hypothetical protein
MLFGKSSVLGSPIITNNRNEIFKSLFKPRMIYGYGTIISFKSVTGFIFCRSLTKGFEQIVMENSRHYWNTLIKRKGTTPFSI